MSSGLWDGISGTNARNGPEGEEARGREPRQEAGPWFRPATAGAALRW